jgi:hypothetical protein
MPPQHAVFLRTIRQHSLRIQPFCTACSSALSWSDIFLAGLPSGTYTSVVSTPIRSSFLPPSVSETIPFLGLHFSCTYLSTNHPLLPLLLHSPGVYAARRVGNTPHQLSQRIAQGNVLCAAACAGADTPTEALVVRGLDQAQCGLVTRELAQ